MSKCLGPIAVETSRVSTAIGCKQVSPPAKILEAAGDSLEQIDAILRPTPRLKLPFFLPNSPVVSFAGE